MWNIEIEAHSSEAYEVLKQAFEDEYVEKEEYEFTVRTARAGNRTFTKERAVVDDVTALQFRTSLKAVQGLLVNYDVPVKIRLSGDEISQAIWIGVD